MTDSWVAFTFIEVCLRLRHALSFLQAFSCCNIFHRIFWFLIEPLRTVLFSLALGKGLSSLYLSRMTVRVIAKKCLTRLF